MGMLLAEILATQDPKLSGPQPGDKTAGFTVFDGGRREELDYIAELKGGPTVLIFFHELTHPGAALMRALVRGHEGRVLDLAWTATTVGSACSDRKVRFIAAADVTIEREVDLPNGARPPRAGP